MDPPPRFAFPHDDPDVPLSWAPLFTHEYLNYFAAKALPEITCLEPVEVPGAPPPPEDVWPVGPEHVDLYREVAPVVRLLDPAAASDPRLRNGDYPDVPPAGTRTRPWLVLVGYACEPDLDLDVGLRLSRRQSVTGGSHGWRHMSFSLLGLRFGACPGVLERHARVALAYLSSGRAYWGWRYLARASHYAADLGHPFHVKVFPRRKLAKLLFRLKRLYQLVAATHNAHEVYVQQRFRSEFVPFAEAVARGAKRGFELAPVGPARFAGWVTRRGGQAAGVLNRLVEVLLGFAGGGLVENYASLSPFDAEDSAKTTSRLERGALEVLFHDPGDPALEALDRLTAPLLEEVGVTLGALFRAGVEAARTARSRF